MGILNDVNDLAHIGSNQTNLQKFVKSALDFVLKNNLSGLNLYWKTVNWNIYDNLSAKADILMLAKELYRSFKPNNLLLTSSFTETYTEIYDFVALSPYFDFMQFDKLQKVDEIIKLGVPSKKIIIELNNNIWSDRVGKFTLSDFNSFLNSFKVYLTYREMCDLLSNNKIISKEYDMNAEEMVARYIDTESKEVYSIRYKNTRILANTTRRAMRRNLGGVCITSIVADDAEGRCNIEMDTFDDFKTNSNATLNIPIRRDATFPILRTINQAIELSLDEMHVPRTLNNNYMNSGNQSNTMTGWDSFFTNLNLLLT